MSICSQSGSFVVCKSLLEYFYVFSATWYMMDLSYSFVETWTTSHRPLNDLSTRPQKQTQVSFKQGAWVCLSSALERFGCLTRLLEKRKSYLISLSSCSSSRYGQCMSRCMEVGFVLPSRWNASCLSVCRQCCRLSILLPCRNQYRKRRNS